MKIIIKYKASIYGPDPKDPEKTKLLYKDRIKHAKIETEDIQGVLEYHNLRGKLEKNRCEIAHKDLGSIVIDKPFKEMCEIWENDRFIVKGFKQYKNEKEGKRI